MKLLYQDEYYKVYLSNKKDVNGNKHLKVFYRGEELKSDPILTAGLSKKEAKKTNSDKWNQDKTREETNLHMDTKMLIPKNVLLYGLPKAKKALKLTFSWEVLKYCENKPEIVVDRGF